MTTLTFSEIKNILEQLNRFDKAIDLIAKEKDDKKKTKYMDLARKIMNDIRTSVDKEMRGLPGMLLEKG